MSADECICDWHVRMRDPNPACHASHEVQTTSPVRKQIAEALTDAADEIERILVQERTTLGMSVQDWLRHRAALLSQPTSSAEPERAGAWTTFRVERTAPPRIEDMAPGTTFARDDRRYLVLSMAHGYTAVDTDGTFWASVDIDPATIRDVTPPTTTPGASS